MEAGGRARGSTRWRAAGACSILACVCTISGSAEAAVTPITRRSAIGGDVYWGSSRRGGLSGGSVFGLVPFFHYELVKDVFFDAQLPFAPYFGPSTYFGLGNPTAGAHYAASFLDDRVTWFVGGRLSAPLASIDSRGWQTANAAAATALAY